MLCEGTGLIYFGITQTFEYLFQILMNVQCGTVGVSSSAKTRMVHTFVNAPQRWNYLPMTTPALVRLKRNNFSGP